MALNTLTLAVVQGVQGRRFRSKINGLTAGTEVTVDVDATPGFGTVNGRLSHHALPYTVNTVAIRERAPATGETKVTRIEIAAASASELAALAAAQITGGRTLRGYRTAATDDGDGSLTWAVYAENDLGATATVAVGGVTPPGLTAVAGDVIDASSIVLSGSPFHVNYDWQRNGVTHAKIYHPTYRSDPGDAGVAITCVVTPYYTDGTAGTPQTYGPVTLTQPAAFSLSQFGAGNYYDNDAAQGVTITGRGVSDWAAVNGTATFTQATDAFRPTYQATGWDGATPTIRFDSSSTQSRELVSDETHFTGWSDFWVGRRDTTDQPATATNKTVYATSQAATAYGVSSYTLRATNDAAQTGLNTVGLGGGGAQGSTGFGKGLPAIYTGVLQDVYRFNMNGAAAFSVTTSSTTAGTGVTRLGTSTVANGARFDIARRIRLNNEALKSYKDGAQAVAKIVEGYLAGLYNSAAADLVAGTTTLRSRFNDDHPFKNRAPNAADFRDLRITYDFWGNSLTNGSAPHFSAGFQGATATNDGVGGNTASEIYTRYLAATDEKKRRITIIGDLVENGTGSAVNGKTTWQEMLADMVATTEALQGVAPGQGQIIIWGRWRNWISPKPLANGPDSVDTANAYIQSTYPNYYWCMARYLNNLGAPGMPYAEATTNYVNSIPPASIQNDNVHPVGAGYILMGDAIEAVAICKGWNRL